LKDPVKAEDAYKKALQSDPANPSYYRSLAEFYQSLGKNAQAETVLRSAGTAVPKAFDLQVLLARMLKQEGKVSEANAVYDATAVAAEKAGNTGLAQSIRDEMSQ
jgi:Tfp pilus assembly protein PilF